MAIASPASFFLLFICREIALLKQQLKEYMGAVQLLKSNSGEISSASSVSTSASSAPPPPDYHQEASHFEDKLIQVCVFFLYCHKMFCLKCILR